MTTITQTDLEQFNARTDQLAAIYQADPQRFVQERGAIDRAQAALDSAKQDAAATIAHRKEYTAMIESAHQAGALNERERSKIFERYASDYATANLDEAQTALDGAWISFWNALKKAEQKTL